MVFQVEADFLVFNVRRLYMLIHGGKFSSVRKMYRIIHSKT